MISDKEREEIAKNVFAACEKRYEHNPVDDIVSNPPIPGTFEYRYSLPGNKLHENEERVKATKVGTLEEIAAALEVARGLDRKAAAENGERFHAAEAGINKYIRSRIADDLGYYVDSTIFKTIYDMAYEDGIKDGLDEVFYLAKKYDTIIQEATRVSKVSLHLM